MFETLEVGRRIRELRLKRNLTQLNLADEIGVSYQAVSGWERGNSMPDISKLEELANILNCTIDELLGSSAETETIKKILNEDDGELVVDLDKVSEIAPLIKPDKTKEIVEKVLKENISIDANNVVALAPYLEQDYLDKLIKENELSFNLTILITLAPFLNKNILDDIACDINVKEDINCLIGIAPFISREVLEKLVNTVINDGNVSECIGLYPFLSKECLHRIADILVQKEGYKSILEIAPFLN